MGNIFDRLAQGPGGMQARDYDDWNEMVGAAPPDRFGRSTVEAVRQIDPQDYYRHTQPGVDGTDPLGTLPSPQRSGLAESLLGALLGGGLGQQDIMRNTGIRNLDPNRMSPDELAALAQWTQQNRPDAFGQVAQQYRDQPDLLSSLLGNKVLMAALMGIGAKMLSDRMRGNQQPQFRQRGF